MKVLCLFFLLLAATAPKAQTTSPFTPYLGQWAGVLQYLDYSSGDTVTIQATLRISALPGDPTRVRLDFDYPREPGHGHSDTLVYTGPATAVLEWHSAEAGADDNKPAILLHGYRFSADALRLWKEVQWDERRGFFLRNQYSFRRSHL